MGDILAFPSRDALGTAFLERELTALLLAKGADEQLIQFANEKLASTYSRVSDADRTPVEVQLPPGLTQEQKTALEIEINRAFEELHQRHHRLTLELAAQVLLTELRLFQESRSD